MHNLFWAVLILFLIASLLRLDWVYYLVYVVGGVWIVSHWGVRRSFRKLDLRREMLYNAFLGEKIPVRLRLTNRAWLPMPWLMVEDRVPLDLKEMDSYRSVLSVGSLAQLDHSYTLYAKRRGYYTVGPLTLTTGDLFGFAEATWQEQSPVYVTVYPEVLPLHKLGLPSRSPFGTLSSRQRIFEDPNRMAGVRSYASGDSMRRIHWKASAHEDTLLVKKFQPAIALNVTIILDLNREAYPLNGAIGASEWAIVVAASVASYVVGQRQPIGLISNGLDSVSEKVTQAIPMRQGQGQLITILTALARIQLHDFGQELSAWLPRRIADLEWGATLIVITPQLDEKALWTLHEAYRRGSNVVVMIVTPQPNFDRLRAQGQKLGVQIHRTIWEKDLQAVH
jgi:uncharacterized protein (DUF58 family)